MPGRSYDSPRGPAYNQRRFEPDRRDPHRHRLLFHQAKKYSRAQGLYDRGTRCLRAFPDVLPDLSLQRGFSSLYETGLDSRRVLSSADLPYGARGDCPSAGFAHGLPGVQRTVSKSRSYRTLGLPDVDVRFRHGSGGVFDALPPVKNQPQRHRKHIRFLCFLCLLWLFPVRPSIQTDRFRAAVINPVEEKFVSSMWLGSKEDFGPEKEQLALADTRFHDCGCVFEILLPPGPTAAERCAGVVPRDDLDTLLFGIARHSECRTVFEEEVRPLRHAECERVRVVDLRLQYGTGHIELGCRQFVDASIRQRLSQSIRDRQLQAVGQSR